VYEKLMIKINRRKHIKIKSKSKKIGDEIKR